MKEEIRGLIEEKGLDILGDYSEAHELREALDYDGSLHELIDSHIDIYYHTLREWAVEESNYEYIEQAVSDGLVDDLNFDYHKAIQAGQYVYYSEQASEAIEEIFNEAQEAN